MLFGAHVSIKGGFDEAVARAVDLGCDSFQIFTRSQRQWRAPEITDDAAAAFREAVHKSGVSCGCVHASYLINLASPESAKRQRAIDATVEELSRAALLGIPNVVVHSGAHMEEGVDAGLELLIASTAEVLNRSDAHSQTAFLLENSAGQGTTLGRTLEELGRVAAAFPAEARLGFCLDTCHLFAAGYAFSTADEYAALKRKIGETVGVERVKVLHFNDSAKPYGSFRDNHASIGQGEIGEAPFEHWVKDPDWLEIPALLETPGGEENYRREIALLRGMAAGQ